MQLQRQIRLLRVIPDWDWSASKDGNSATVALWSTHCSLDAVGYLSASHHAAIQHWPSGSLCAGNTGLVLGPSEDLHSFLFLMKKQLPLSDGVTSQDNVNCCYFHLHLCSSWFQKIFPDSLSEHLSYFDILFTQEKEKRIPQIPIKPQTLEL